MPIISIIVPVYNNACDLTERLQKIIANTEEAIEFVLVNDGSTDNSLEIMINLQAIYGARVKVYTQINSGAGVARNLGLKYATGEYIGFLDADDYYYENDSLRKLYNRAKENNADICGGNIFRDNYGKLELLIEDNLYKKTGIIEYKDNPFVFFFTRFIYKRKMLEENNIYFPEIRIFEDPVFLVRACLVASKIYMTNEKVYCYRLSHGPIVWDVNKIIGLLEGFCAIFKQYNIEKQKKLCNELQQWLDYKYYPQFRKNQIRKNVNIRKKVEELNKLVKNITNSKLNIYMLYTYGRWYRIFMEPFKYKYIRFFWYVKIFERICKYRGYTFAYRKTKLWFYKRLLKQDNNKTQI